MTFTLTLHLLTVAFEICILLKPNLESYSMFFTLHQSGTGKSTARIGDGPILTLDKLERQQAGVYQCTADNGVGDPVTVDMRLDVLCKYTIKYV